LHDGNVVCRASPYLYSHQNAPKDFGHPLTDFQRSVEKLSGQNKTPFFDKQNRFAAMLYFVKLTVFLQGCAE